MSLKHGLLGLLRYGSMTGYELDKTFKDSLNFFWSAGTSQIYRELNEMEGTGWLSSEVVIQNDRPNRKVYSITERGNRELLRWLASAPSARELKIRNSFLMRIFFAGELSLEKNLQTLEAFRKRAEDSLTNMAGVGVNIDRYRNSIEEPNMALFWKLTADFGTRYDSMCIAWAEHAMELLRRMINEGFGTEWQSPGKGE